MLFLRIRSGSGAYILWCMEAIGQWHIGFYLFPVLVFAIPSPPDRPKRRRHQRIQLSYTLESKSASESGLEAIGEACLAVLYLAIPKPKEITTDSMEEEEEREREGREGEVSIFC